jgi:hypothetical protein
MVATREQLIDNACSILIDAYEGGSCGIASWAVANGTYKWANDGKDYELGKMGTHASVTLYDMEDLELAEEDDPEYGMESKGFDGWDGWMKFGKPLYIDSEIIADFIVKVGKGELDLSKVPDYGRLNDDTLKALFFMYNGIGDPFADWDCINADQVVQFILLGEVTYG